MLFMEKIDELLGVGSGGSRVGGVGAWWDSSGVSLTYIYVIKVKCEKKSKNMMIIQKKVFSLWREMSENCEKSR